MPSPVSSTNFRHPSHAERNTRFSRNTVRRSVSYQRVTENKIFRFAEEVVEVEGRRERTLQCGVDVKEWLHLDRSVFIKRDSRDSRLSVYCQLWWWLMSEGWNCKESAGLITWDVVAAVPLINKLLVNFARDGN